MSDPTLHFTAAPDAAEALAAMRKRHHDAGAGDADIIVALGGDGFMLQTLHAFLGKGKPIYGMNLGSVGFLMNEYRADDLIERLAAAERAVIHPLRMKAQTAQRRHRGAGLQRSLAAARKPARPPKSASMVDERAAHRRTDLRRRAGFHPRRIDRL